MKYFTVLFPSILWRSVAMSMNNISPWPDEVVWSKVEQLIVEGVAKA